MPTPLDSALNATASPGLAAILASAGVVLLIIGLRYAVVAGLAFWLADPSRRRPWGRPHIERPQGFALGLHVRRELRQSARTVLVFAAVHATVFGLGGYAHSQLYFRISDYPLWWLLACVPAMLLLHDTFFYWLHRAMHLPALFARMHRPHHDSLHPTAFAAYSFGWLEALAEALIVVAILFILPVHPLALVVFQTVSIAYNAYGHCGREFYPRHVGQSRWGRWLNTSSLHAHHHRHGRGNYGLYFTLWDRLMGTLVADAQR